MLRFTAGQTKDEIRAQAQAFIEAPTHLAELLAAYERVHGNLLDSDRATQMILSETDNAEVRTLAVAAVYPAAKRLVDEIYLRKLDGGSPTGLFAFTGGGPASGKSALLESLRQKAETDDAIREFFRAEVIFDGTMSDRERAGSHVGLALRRGKRVRIFFVFQPFRDAVEGAIRRAIATGGERPLRMDVLAHGHFGAWQTARELKRAFAGADFGLKVLRFVQRDVPFVEEPFIVIEQAAKETTLAQMIELAYDLLESHRAELPTHLYEAMRKPDR